MNVLLLPSLLVCVCLCPWLAQTVKSLEVGAIERISNIEYSMRHETLAMIPGSDIWEGRKQKWPNRARSVPAMSKVPYKTGRQSCGLVVPWDPSYKSLQITSSISELSTIYQRYTLLGSSRTDTFLSAHTSSIHTVEHRISLRYYVYTNTISPLCFSQT